MTTTLYAQPYDISATGFYFETAAQFQEKVKKAVNDFDHPVEEFEIQFIDGEQIDCELAKAIQLNQANVTQFLEVVDEWEDWEKVNVIIAVGECDYSFKPDTGPTDFDITIYEVDSLEELAQQFVEEGLYGDIPKSLEFYINYEAIACDLSMEYVETTIAGGTLIYACN